MPTATESDKWLGEGESEPIFRAGLSLVEGQSLEAWDRLRGSLIKPRGGRLKTPRPKRRVVKWRPPTRAR